MAGAIFTGRCCSARRQPVAGGGRGRAGRAAALAGASGGRWVGLSQLVVAALADGGAAGAVAPGCIAAAGADAAAEGDAGRPRGRERSCAAMGRSAAGGLGTGDGRLPAARAACTAALRAAHGPVAAACRWQLAGQR
ncbi:hypothetical protein G6F35_015235 [Rhizopus arrhizus]|nr:hypothetical protein G6F35_015235 [Rhizopus arrhizus]